MTPAAQDAERGMSGLNVKSLALGVTLGNLASQAISRVTSGLVALGREALAAVGSYEMLSLSTEALVAKELRAADATLSMEQALDQAAPRAQELLQWIEQLAIASPFSSEDVSSAFQLAQTYGFTGEQAQILTTAILNFAAATGKSGAIMQQLALPLGQILKSSKLLTQDLRQLTGAGIDVSGMLEKMGKSWADVTAGTVDTNEFLQTFVQTLNEDFGGAAARTQATLQGITASFVDLKNIGLRNLLTPSIKALEEAVAPLIGQVQQRLLPALQAAGQLLGEFTRAVIANRDAILQAGAVVGAFVIGFIAIPAAISLATAALGALATAIAFLLTPMGLVGVALGTLAALFAVSFDDIRAKTGTTLESFQSDLFSYGHNLIISLAEGMATAISYVLDVLIQVGNLIANWLQPGSPPRLLPDIDTWGADTFNEYLRGFLDADFGIFNQLGSTIEGYLRSLSTGDNENLIPSILGVREAIAAAIDQMRQTGTVGEDALQGIFNTLGAVNPDLQEYIRLMFAATQASDALKAAQEQLNAITERYKNLLSPLRDELNAISDEQQRTARQDRRTELNAILEQARAAGNIEAERRALLELRALDLQDQIALIETQEEAETSAAQEAVDAAAEQAAAAAEQLAAQHALIAAQTENNRLIQAQIALLERLAEAASGAAGGGPTGGGAAGLPPGLLDLGDIAGMGDPGELFNLDALRERITSFLGELTAPFAGIQSQVQELGAVWSEVFLNISNAPQSLVDSLNQMASTAGSDILLFVNEAVTNFMNLQTQIGLIALQILAKATETFGNLQTQVGGIVLQLVSNAVKNFGNLQTQVGEIFLKLMQNGVENFFSLQTQVGEIVLQLVREALTNFDSLMNQLTEILGQLVVAAVTKMAEWAAAIVTAVYDAGVWLGTKVLEFYNLGADLIGGMAQGVLDGISGLVSAVISGVQEAINAAVDLIQPGSPSRVTAALLGRPFAQGIGMGIIEAMPQVKRIVASELGGLLTAAEAISLPASSAQVAGQTITNNYSSTVTGVQNANVNNGIDMAMLESFILSTVNRAMAYA